MSTTPESLPPDEAHVWLVDPASLRDAALLRQYDCLMSADERQKQRRFMFEKDRHTCLVTRALVRTVLSRYAPVAPDGWTFVSNEHGRPELAAGQCDLPLRFNLSHSDGLVACAVTRSHDIGVDVEPRDRRSETLAVADRYFSADEVRALHALSPGGQRERFFDYWTLKESYIKARGLGLALPLGHFTFRLQCPDSIAIEFDPRLLDDASAWQFLLQRPTSRHTLALAIRRGDQRDRHVRTRWTVPLVD